MTAAPSGRTERWLFAFTALLALLLLLVPAWPLLTGRVLVYLDLGAFHLPIRAFYSRCLAAGQPFDWTPDLYGGMFLSGEGEHGPYHPLHLLLYRLLPLHTAFALETFLHCPLLLAGLFVFLRRYVRPAPALLGALCYTFCSGSVLRTIYPNYQGVIAHLPWLLWLLDVAGATSSVPKRRLALAGVALLTGSQLLLGAPQALSYSLLAEGLFVLFLAWHRRPRWTFWPEWLTANLLALLIGSVQLLATRALLADSTRGGFDPLLGSLRPSLLTQLLAPDLLSGHLPPFYSSEFLYFGCVPVILGLAWLGFRRAGGVSPPSMDAATGGLRPPLADRLAVFALVLGLLSGWLSLGKYGYLYHLQTCLPLVGQLRLPARYFTLTALAACLLAAVAFDRLIDVWRSGRPLPWRRLALPWAGVAAALTLAVAFRLAYPKESALRIDRNYFAGPLFLCGAALAATAAARGRSVGLFALVALAVVDIDVFNLKVPFGPGQGIWSLSFPLDEYRARAQAPPLPRQGRWLDEAWELPHPALLGQPVLTGYRGGLEPKKWLDYGTVAALRAAHTAWHRITLWEGSVVLPGLRHVADRWYEVPDPLPRLRLVGRAHVSDNPAVDIGTIDLKTTALVTHPVDVEDGPAGTVRLSGERPGELALHVSAPGRRLLVVADSYHAGWTAAVDDVPVTVERVNGDFLGCVVQPGEHDVRFVFHPACLRLGRLLSLAGLGLTLLVVVGCGVSLVSRSPRAVGGPGRAPPCG